MAMSTSILTQSAVIEAIGPTFTDWYRLGIFLKIPSGLLDAIRTSDHDARTQCKEFVTLWLETKKEATWADLCHALKVLGKYGLANRISSKYLSDTEQSLSSGKYSPRGISDSSKPAQLTSDGNVIIDDAFVGPKPDRQALALTSSLRLNRSGPYIK